MEGMPTHPLGDTGNGPNGDHSLGAAANAAPVHRNLPVAKPSDEGVPTSFPSPIVEVGQADSEAAGANTLNFLRCQCLPRRLLFCSLLPHAFVRQCRTFARARVCDGLQKRKTEAKKGRRNALQAMRMGRTPMGRSLRAVVAPLESRGKGTATVGKQAT